MQLPHPRDDGFLALCVEVNSKSGVLSGEPVDAFGELIQIVLVGDKSGVRKSASRCFNSELVNIYLVGRLHGHGYDGLGDVDGLLWYIR